SMSIDYAITYTSVHSKARQLFEQAPRFPEYVPENHIPVCIPEPEHPKDLVPAEDEATIPPLPPFFLSPLIRPLHTKATMRQMRAASPSTYHSLLPSGTPPLLPIPLPTPSTSRRAGIPEADTSPRKRILLTTLRPSSEVGESSAAAARQPGPTMAHRVDYSLVDPMETRLRDIERRMMTALELVNMRVTYQSTETHEALTRSEAYCRALEARVAVLETQAYRHEWQRQGADDHAVEHIMRQGADDHAVEHMDTLEDTGSSS
ncbi:hypothetical protein Tco_1208019, partial [Tanacetum coccineum]